MARDLLDEAFDVVRGDASRRLEDRAEGRLIGGEPGPLRIPSGP